MSIFINHLFRIVIDIHDVCSELNYSNDYNITIGELGRVGTCSNHITVTFSIDQDMLVLFQIYFDRTSKYVSGPILSFTLKLDLQVYSILRMVPALFKYSAQSTSPMILSQMVLFQTGKFEVDFQVEVLLTLQFFHIQ